LASAEAKEIEGKVMEGTVGDAWKYIRDIQRGRAGLNQQSQKLSGNWMVYFARLQWRICTGGNNILTLY